MPATIKLLHSYTIYHKHLTDKQTYHINMARSEAHNQRNAQFREAFLKPWDFANSAPPTGKTIESEAKELGLAHEVDDIPNGQGAKLHWLGNTKPDIVVLYFHGNVVLPSLSETAAD